jgi:hypothetical protein
VRGDDEPSRGESEREKRSGGATVPTFRELIDWVEGRLGPDDEARVAAAVEAGDNQLTSTVAWIEGFTRFGRQHPLPPTPPIVRQRLRQAFVRHHGHDEAVRRELAAPMFDSRDEAVLAGVRGGSDSDEGYRLAFASESVGVLVDVMAQSDTTVRLEGQVLGPEDSAPVWEVTVEHPNGRRTDVGGDENGSFSIEGVPLDVSRLLLTNGQLEVEIPDPLHRVAGRT